MKVKYHLVFLFLAYFPLIKTWILRFLKMIEPFQGLIICSNLLCSSFSLPLQVKILKKFNLEALN